MSANSSIGDGRACAGGQQCKGQGLGDEARARSGAVERRASSCARRSIRSRTARVRLAAWWNSLRVVTTFAPDSSNRQMTSMSARSPMYSTQSGCSDDDLVDVARGHHPGRRQDRTARRRPCPPWRPSTRRARRARARGARSPPAESGARCCRSPIARPGRGRHDCSRCRDGQLLPAGRGGLGLHRVVVVHLPVGKAVENFVEGNTAFEAGQGAPRQKWMPWPNVRWSPIFRWMSNTSPSGNRRSSRLAAGGGTS